MKCSAISALLVCAACISSSAIAKPKITFFDVPGATATTVTAVNSNGEIIGIADLHAYVRHLDGSFETIDDPVAQFTIPEAMNSRNSIVGSFETTDVKRHGFLRHPATKSFQTITIEGAGFTDAKAINSTRAIVGNWVDKHHPHGPHGFIRNSDGNVIKFDIPGASGTDLVAINAGGDIAGNFTDSNNQSTPSFWHPMGRSRPSTLRTQFRTPQLPLMMRVTW